MISWMLFVMRRGEPPVCVKVIQAESYRAAFKQFRERNPSLHSSWLRVERIV